MNLKITAIILGTAPLFAVSTVSPITVNSSTPDIMYGLVYKGVLDVMYTIIERKSEILKTARAHPCEIATIELSKGMVINQMARARNALNPLMTTLTYGVMWDAHMYEIQALVTKIDAIVDSLKKKVDRLSEWHIDELVAEIRELRCDGNIEPFIARIDWHRHSRIAKLLLPLIEKIKSDDDYSISFSAKFHIKR